MGKLDCDVVRDLLPNYIEELTSPATNEKVNNHLRSCKDCHTIYESMKEDIPMEQAPENVPVKSFLYKVKSRYVMNVLTLLGAIAIIVCLIVNLAVERKVSWSFIVIGSVAFFLCITLVFLTSKKNRFFNALLCMSILVIPFLGIIQIAMRYLMDLPYEVWFWSKGVPLSLIWMIAAWIFIAIVHIFKFSAYTNSGIACLLIFPSSLLTNWSGGVYTSWRVFLIQGVGNALLVIIIAVIFFILAAKQRAKK